MELEYWPILIHPRIFTNVPFISLNDTWSAARDVDALTSRRRPLMLCSVPSSLIRATISASGPTCTAASAKTIRKRESLDGTALVGTHPRGGGRTCTYAVQPQSELEFEDRLECLGAVFLRVHLSFIKQLTVCCTFKPLYFSHSKLRAQRLARWPRTAVSQWCDGIRSMSGPTTLRDEWVQKRQQYEQDKPE